MNLVSFDIFDSTLIRKCGKPENIFYLLAKYLFPNDSKKQDAFFMWRLRAEERAEDRIHKRNLSLHEIYTVYDEFEGDNNCESILASEKMIESQQLISNLEVKELIAEKRAEGNIICFISDMYLDGEFLKSVLIREGCAMPDDRVFVSCECDRRKDDAQLFLYVKEQFCDVQSWEHYGDNRISDVKVPQSLGIRSHLIKTSETNCEAWMKKLYNIFPFGRDLSVLIGFQRCARLHLSSNTAEYINASDFVAPVILSYLFFLRNKVREMKINRLYFLSRDSYIFYKIAVDCNFFGDVNCRYLFLSRKSLALPLLSELTKERMLAIFGWNIKGMKSSEAFKLLKLEDLFSREKDFIIKTEKDIDHLMELLHGRSKLILDRQLHERKLLDAYFAQEGVYDNTDFAVIDVGWLGTTRMMLNLLRADQGLSHVPFLYFGINRNVISTKYGDFCSFLPYEFLNSNMTIFLEAYCCSSKYPSTISYTQHDGEYGPVFKKSQKLKDKLCQVHVEVCESIINYIANIPSIETSVAMSVWWSSIQQLETHYDFIDYKFFSNVYSIDDGLIIRKISLLELIKYFITGRIKGEFLVDMSIYNCYRIKFDRNHCLRNRLKKILHLVRS